MKGICFIEPLFSKVVAGQKTQTRRIITQQPDGRGLRSSNVPFEDWHGNEFKPKYMVGETVYLKEPYLSLNNQEPVLIYKYGEDYSDVEELSPIKWSNKLFMPQYAARHFIKITGVRAERLRDISEEDCIKEGITKHKVIRLDRIWYVTVNEQSGWPTAQKAYAALIDHINGKGTWDSNPWVWVYDFEKSYGF
jgi:hypothetical protein